MFFILFFIFIVPFTSYSSLADPNALQNVLLKMPAPLSESLKKYGDPLSKQKEHRIIEADHAKSQLLEKGAFQYSMWLKYQQNPKDQGIIDYMLYKTKKYALCKHISILKAQDLFTSTLYKKSKINDSLFRLQNMTGYHFFKAQIRKSDFILSFLNKMDTKLCEFQEKGSDRLFTAQDMMSFVFLFAFLDDFAHNRKIDYWVSSFELLHKIHCQDELDHNKVFFEILGTYKEGDYAPINFDRLKEWYGNQEHFIFPIFNKKGTIGLSILIHAISSRIVLIGCGSQAAPVHNNRWQALTDTMFHDFLHARLPIRIIDNLTQPTDGELFFKTVAAEHVIKLSKVYKKAIKYKDNNAKKIALNPILALFYCLHEQVISSFYFDVKEGDEIKRESVDKYINLFLGFYMVQHVSFFGLYKSNLFPYFSLEDALFNGVDMLLLYKIAYPELNNVLKDNGFIIKNGVLQSSDPAIKNNIDEGKLKIVLEKLKVCMISAWNQFYLDYRLRYNNTVPFEPCLTVYQ